MSWLGRRYHVIRLLGALWAQFVPGDCDVVPRLKRTYFAHLDIASRGSSLFDSFGLGAAQPRFPLYLVSSFDKPADVAALSPSSLPSSLFVLCYSCPFAVLLETPPSIHSERGSPINLRINRPPPKKKKDRHNEQ